MKISGRVWKFGDNLQGDYDVVPYPLVREYTDRKEIAKYCMVNVDSEFPLKAAPGDIIVAGEAFGAGVCHPHAFMAIAGLEISLVVAESVARASAIIHAVQEGLPVWEAPGITSIVETGDVITVDLASGTVRNETTGEELAAEPMGEPISRRLKAGGLVPYIQQRMRELGLPTAATSRGE